MTNGDDHEERIKDLERRLKGWPEFNPLELKALRIIVWLGLWVAGTFAGLKVLALIVKDLSAIGVSL